VWSLRTGEFGACGTFFFPILKVACDVIVLFVVMRRRRCALRVMASVHSESVSEGVKFAIPPPAHPTYDLLHLIRLSLAEDAGDHGTLLLNSMLNRFFTSPPGKNSGFRV